MADVNLVGTHVAAQGLAKVTNLEPCAAVFDDCVFCTAGPMAFGSTDGGRSFPIRFFGQSLFGGVAVMDQTCVWLPGISRLAWAMLTADSPERVRLCLASKARFLDSAATSWLFLEFDPGSLGLAGRHLDYPQLAVGRGMLYITVMTRRSSDSGNTGAAIIRIPINQLASEQESTIHYQYWSTEDVKNFGLCQDVGSTGYWAGHLIAQSKLRVYRWDETSGTIYWSDLGIPGFQSERANYESRTPGGDNWLSKLDYRITAGALTRGPKLGNSGYVDELVFGWTAGRDHANGRPQPFIRLVGIAYYESLKRAYLTDWRDIYHGDYAWAFPSLSSIKGGVLAISIASAGEKFHVQHEVGFVEVPLRGNSALHIAAVAESTASAERWGDFLCIGHLNTLPLVFVSAGFTVHPDPAPTPTSPTLASVHVARFAPI